MLKRSVLLLLMCTKAFCPQKQLFPKTPFDRSVDAVGQSRAMSLYDKSAFQQGAASLTKKIFRLSDELAASEYQQLAQDAQAIFGIPEAERQLLIKKMGPANIFGQTVCALAQSDALYINEENLNKRTPGARRCAVLHEAVHIKYHDNSALVIAAMVGIPVAALAHALIKSIKTEGCYTIFHVLGVLSAGLIGAGLSLSKCDHYLERRADIEAHYAARCHMCVQEAAAQRRDSFERRKNPLKNNGYLWADDLEKIAADLKEQNHVCEQHAKK